MRRAEAKKSLLYLAIALGMIIYAIPRLPVLTLTEEGLFTLLWLSYALLALGANLYFLMGVDRDRHHRGFRRRAWEREMRRMATFWQEDKRDYRRMVR